MIQVDGTNYQWMGIPGAPQNVNQTSFSYTSTKSTFVMDVGGFVQMTITFFSPITPNDLQRQSLPLSYLSVRVQSTDGNSHNVKLYADISAGLYHSQNLLNHALTKIRMVRRRAKPVSNCSLELRHRWKCRVSSSVPTGADCVLRERDKWQWHGRLGKYLLGH